MNADTIARYLEDAPAPVTGAKLVKDLGSRERWTAKQADAQLSDMVRAGRAFRWSRQRYWHRDAALLARDEIPNIAAGGALERRAAVREAVAANDFGRQSGAVGPARPPRRRPAPERKDPRPGLGLLPQMPEAYGGRPAGPVELPFEVLLARDQPVAAIPPSPRCC